MSRARNLMKIRGLMIAFSILVMIAGITGTVLQGGFNLGIDFRPGISQTVYIEDRVTTAQVRDTLSNFDGIQIQRLGDSAENRFTIRLRDDGTIQNFEREMAIAILTQLQATFGTVIELESDYVSARFSRDLSGQAIFLTLFALGLILVYLWFRFRLGYAISAITALIHDIIVIVGVIGTFQLEVSTATIAAVLTIIGYSLNDTIVIFDRIRENELIEGNEFLFIVNLGVTQSLSRTVITSLTTLLAVLAIFVFSTGLIQLFALKLAIGVVVGTYSSIFIASPTLLLWHNVGVSRRAKKAVRAGSGNKTAKVGEDTSTKKIAVNVEAAKQEIVEQRRKKNRRKKK